jgi:hypothetical protein
VTAVRSAAPVAANNPRDQHIPTIEEKGGRAWQKAVGDGQRALVETMMFRYQTLIVPTLRARKFAV